MPLQLPLCSTAHVLLYPCARVSARTTLPAAAATPLCTTPQPPVLSSAPTRSRVPRTGACGRQLSSAPHPRAAPAHATRAAPLHPTRRNRRSGPCALARALLQPPLGPMPGRPRALHRAVACPPGAAASPPAASAAAAGRPAPAARAEPRRAPAALASALAPPRLGRARA
jgi:hypothetical protein